MELHLSIVTDAGDTSHLRSLTIMDQTAMIVYDSEACREQRGMICFCVGKHKLKVHSADRSLANPKRQCQLQSAR